MIDCEMQFRNSQWIVGIDLLTYWPWLFVNLSFYHLDGEPLKWLSDAPVLAYETKTQQSANYIAWNKRSSYATYAWMLWSELHCQRAVLEACYLPLLRGEYTFADYEAFAALRGKMANAEG